MRWEVRANRTDTRWWLVACLMHDEGRSSYGTLVDYATTTSRTKAQGWIAAVEAMVDFDIHKG